MNSIVCLALIYLCLGYVAGFKGENIEFNNSSVRNCKFTCESGNECDHHWYHTVHTYTNDQWQHPTYIGIIPKQTSVKITHFVLKLETFDNNTELHCDTVCSVPIWYGFSTGTKTSSFLLPVIRIGTNQTLKDNEEPAVLKYNETQKVSFKCQEYIYKTKIVIGVINQTTNIITTHYNTFLGRIFDKSQNGTVLCCIYFEETGVADEKWITRRIAKKTLLVYDDTVTVPVTVRQNSSEEKDINFSNSTGNDVKSPDKDKQYADSGKQNADSYKQDADSGKQESDSGKQDADSGKQDPDSSNHTIIIYTVSAVAVVFILLVVSVIYLKRCRKKPKVEVETKVLYVDLDFLRRNEPESLPREGPEEESPYAQIIGELRPQST